MPLISIEFAELELTGKVTSDALEAVEHYLSICTECRDECLLLRNAIRKMDG